MIAQLVRRIFCKLWDVLVRRPFYHRRFGLFGKRSVLIKPLMIDGARQIYIHDEVIIKHGGWLAAVPLTGASTCQLRIGKGAVIGNFNHIYATRSIIIEDEVLTADKVYISDCAHGYEEVNTAILKQNIVQLKDVVIGRGAWLGENVCVIGASVGRGSVIGANSVVTHDIPDYCVAVGAPAKVIKRYNHTTKQWEKIS